MAKRKKPVPADRSAPRLAPRFKPRPAPRLKLRSRIHRPTLVICLLAAVLAAIPFGYGKYLEFNTNGAFDGGLNVYSAQCIVNGQKLNIEVFPSARPATLLVNVIGVALFGFSEFGPKLIQTLLQLTALALMFYTLRKIYGIFPAAVALLLAAFYLSCPPFAKFGNVKEQFMVACMIITTSAFILCYLNGNRWWLLLSGAMAINTYYFKPTGFSVVIALGVYLLAQPLLRRCRWRQTGSDLLRLFWGTALGLLPLAAFYTWQGQLRWFLGRFPAAPVVFIMEVYVACLILRSVIHHAGWRQVKLRYVAVMLAGVAVVFVLALVYFACKGQLLPYLRDIPFVDYPIRFIRKAGNIWREFSNLATTSTGYLSGSRTATNFLTQYNSVVAHYHSFIVPIGLSLLAIGVFLKRSFYRQVAGENETSSSSKSSATVTPQPQQKFGADNFVLLLAVWWLLDMLFVWISPRDYVEYYLPLNASAAMLAAYALYRCRENPIELLWLLSAWLIVDLLLVWIIPSATFPYLGLRSAEGVGEYWGQFFLRTIMPAVSVAIYMLTKKKSLQPARVVILMLIACGMFFWLNSTNLGEFKKRVKNLRLMRQQGLIYPWEQVAHYIRDRSSPDDGLYVWGWYPGIYVQAHRFCPATMPAYGDMHTDNPELVQRKIKQLVNQLQAHPPKFIVDSQKPHFPFYDHPVFDLWPRWQDRKKSVFQLRFHQNQPLKHNSFLAPKNLEKYRDLLLRQVEQFSYILLTKNTRKGGPLSPDKARELTQREKARHAAMYPLRRFVMKNYTPVPLHTSMYVFQYNP